MTTFRSDLIDPERLTYQFVSANEPDTVVIEVALEGNVLIDMSMDRQGRTSVLFDPDRGQLEFDLAQLRAVLDKCQAELSAWRHRLTERGAIWDRTT